MQKKIEKSKKENPKQGKIPRKIEKRREKIPRLRGMKDVLPDDFVYWDLILKKGVKLAKAYGFRRLEAPILEYLSLYEKSNSQDTDLISKEMYSFIDKSDEKIAVRPEITPGIVRAYIEHGMFNWPQPVKLLSIGAVCRHEKPQSGRLRQFTQYNLEVYGEQGPIVDVQLIQLAYTLLTGLQLNVKVQINSIGCVECRKEYIKKLTDFYKERGKRAKLCLDCKKRFVKNPLRLLDCKESVCVEVRSDAPQIIDFLCDGCKDHFIKVLEYMDELEIPYNLNPLLVRGLDYYNRTVFEIWPQEEEEKEENEAISRQFALAAGGRYDSLVEHLGGRPTPACGFGMGIERVVLKIKEKNIPLEEEKDIVFLAQLGDASRRKSMVLFEKLRKAGINVRESFTKDSLKIQLEDANRLKARYSLILGQKEMLDGMILIRDMESGTQELIDYNKVYNEIIKRLENK